MTSVVGGYSQKKGPQPTSPGDEKKRKRRGSENFKTISFLENRVTC